MWCCSIVYVSAHFGPFDVVYGSILQSLEKKKKKDKLHQFFQMYESISRKFIKTELPRADLTTCAGATPAAVSPIVLHPSQNKTGLKQTGAWTCFFRWMQHVSVEAQCESEPDQTKTQQCCNFSPQSNRVLRTLRCENQLSKLNYKNTSREFNSRL